MQSLLYCICIPCLPVPFASNASSLQRCSRKYVFFRVVLGIEPRAFRSASALLIELFPQPSDTVVSHAQPSDTVVSHVSSPAFRYPSISCFILKHFTCRLLKPLSTHQCLRILDLRWVWTSKTVMVTGEVRG